VALCGRRSAEHKAAFADPRVSFVQADLTRDAHVDRAFNPAFGPYDYVFNLAGETKCGLAESVYASKVSRLGVCQAYRRGGLPLSSLPTLRVVVCDSVATSRSNAVSTLCSSFSSCESTERGCLNGTLRTLLSSPPQPRRPPTSVSSALSRCRPRSSTSRRPSSPRPKAPSCSHGRSRPSTSWRYASFERALYVCEQDWQLITCMLWTASTPGGRNDSAA
jgi:hypothetical protein